MSNGWETDVINVDTSGFAKGSPEWFGYHDRLLKEWQSSQSALQVAKDREMALRKKYVELAFDTDKLSGTERVDIGGGWQAKAVKKLNWGFKSWSENVTVLDAVDAAMSMCEKLSPEAGFIADRLVKWSAEPSMTEYNKLAESEVGRQVKAIFDKVIESKPGAPTLELVPPKGQK